MDSSESKILHVSEVVKVKCRICQVTLKRKNYKAHLKNVHPKENPEDLSGWSQPKIPSMFSSFFGQKTGKMSSSNQSEDTMGDDHSEVAEPDADQPLGAHDEGAGDGGGLSEEDAALGDNTSSGNLKKRKCTKDDFIVAGEKKRFLSGDSAFGDILGDEDDGMLEVEADSQENLPSKLDQILQQLQEHKQQLNLVHQEVKELKQNKIQDIGLNNDSKVEEHSTEMRHILMLLSSARSIEDIEGIGFKYDEENMKVKCVLCDSSQVDSDKPASYSGEFKYNSQDGVKFDEKSKMSRNFINMKAHLKAHILRNKTHSLQLEIQTQKNAAECELVSKNRKAGLNLGRAALKNYIQGRPYSDFENDVFMMKKSGGTVGEINHSRKFPASFRKSVARVVNGRIKKFIQKPLKQTGHLPPVAISADKGTFKGTPRQFCGVVTVNPGGENFLEVLSAGQPVVSEGSSGRKLAENMKAAFNHIGVSAQQIKSGVFDGVYDHVSIKKHLADLYPDLNEDEFLFTWDPLHKTGLADKHMCNQKGEHKWIVKFNNTCHQLFNTFHWGASHVQLREAAMKSGIKPRNLVNFSETRFANSKRRVYQVILDMFPAIMTCLDHYILEGERNRSGLEASNRDVREKADKAKELKGKVMNAEFLLLLSGLCDIYEEFGRVVQVT